MINYSFYTDYIKTFINNDIETWDFKSNIIYKGILEHIGYELGLQCLEVIKEKYSDFYDKYKSNLIELANKNDLYGKTDLCNYIDFCICSPSNMRYILHSLLILSFMKKCNINNIDIIEIGAGYGGLCFYIYNIAPLFNINIDSYSIFDLPEAMLLQEKYLNKLNITNVNFENLNNIKNLKKNSFLISNYAYSEFNKEYRIEYTNSVLNPYTSYGFFAWNTFFPHNYKFVDDKNITIINEYPNTGDDKNFYVYYEPFDKNT